MRHDARLLSILQPTFGGAPRIRGRAQAGASRAAAPLPAWIRSLWLGAGAILAIGALALAVILLSVRTTHAERILPNISVGGVAVGGMPVDTAAAALADRARALEASEITFTRGETVWRSTLRDIGVTVDDASALVRAEGFGREDSAFHRLRSATLLARSGADLSLPIELDYQKLDAWLDTIDRELGAPPRNAAVEIQGSNVVIVPEVDGLVVDREAAREEIAVRLENLEPIHLTLPTSTRIATIRAVDLEPAREMLVAAMSHPVQVSNGGGTWTLPSTELAQFVKQDVVPSRGGAPAITLGLDRERLSAWLDERLGALIATEPVDAVLGWDGAKVVSVEPSVDGVRLDAPKLAELVEAQFFGAGGTVVAPLTSVKPAIDSKNLGALGITTLLGSGQSNYSGSNDGRATNVAVGASLLNSTLIPPWGEFSFNGAIGVISEEKGFVEAQVIDGENIGQDIGGGICQVSTTVFRAAYLAGLPITEWWPHRFRIGFYEYDGWEPGLDASILQPTEDPATWADFRFENPSDSWMLVESWTDGVNVVVNIYGADLGYDVESTGPTWGAKSQMLGAKEVVDDDLDPGTVTLAQVAGIGEELSHYRVVRNRDGELLWERSFYTKYFPRGDVWKVSPDMKGQAPIDPTFKFPPLPPAGVDSHDWVPGMELPAADGAAAAPNLDWAPVEEWTPPAEEWAPAADQWADPNQWTDPNQEWVAPADAWAPPAESAVWE